MWQILQMWKTVQTAPHTGQVANSSQRFIIDVNVYKHKLLTTSVAQVPHFDQQHNSFSTLTFLIGCGLNHQLGHTKDFKNCTHPLPA